MTDDVDDLNEETNYFSDKANTIRYTLENFVDDTYDSQEFPSDIVDTSYQMPTVYITYSSKPTVQYEFVDTDESNAPLSDWITVSGDEGQSVSTGITDKDIPAGYKLLDGQELPTSVTLYNINSPVLIGLQHTTVNKTYTFVDDDESETTVSTKTVSGKWGKVVDTGLTVPDGYELASGQTLPTSVTLDKTSNPAVPIHLVHKIETVTDPSETQQTRTITVKFVNAKTGESMGNLAPDAVLDVYYKRTVTKDLVTGKTTYGEWFWDTTQGDSATPGYHVVSGTWTTPASTEWANVVATVPTVSGYTAFTTGDWSSNTDAAAFVNPIWNNYGTGGTNTDKDRGSLAYTSDAPIYAAQATHTVYYVPDETSSRTVTINYKYYENGQVGGDVYSPAQLQIFYRATASSYSVADGAKYNTATFDTTQGDSATPGFHVISTPAGASWVGVTNNDGNNTIGVPVPTKAGYQAVWLGSSAATEIYDHLSTPNTGNAFLSDTDWLWSSRKTRTILYVPDSYGTKTVTRTINVTNPTTGAVTTTTQTVTFKQTIRLNDDDNGVVYGALKNNDVYSFVSGTDLWNSATSADGATTYNQTATVAGNPTGTWAEYTAPTYSGYTALIDGTAGTEVAANDQVAYNTADQTVNITYAATITLNGSGTVTYTGNVAKIPTGSYSVTLSDGKTYTLQDGDLEFASTGNTNVGDYTVKLSAAGLQHINALTGRNYVYTYNNGTAKLTIAPATATATITGADSKVYDGTVASLSGDKYSVTLSNGMTYTLQDGDYAFADSTGKIISAPTDFGSYQVVLTDQGKANIEKLTKAGDVNNYTWTFDSNATYDITAQKMAIVVTGEASKIYDGTNATITADDLKNLSLKWSNNTSAPSGITYTLSADDLEVVDANGNPVSASNYRNGKATGVKYYIVLKDSALAKIQAQNKNYQFSLAATAKSPTTSDALYKIYARKAALTLNGSQTVNYGDLTALDLSKFTVDFSNWTDITETKPVITLQNGDLVITNPGDTETSTDGQSKVPVNVGNYTVKMSSQLINRLKEQYTNYDFDEIDSTKDSQGNVQAGMGQDPTHNPALYIVQARQIDVTLSGKQTIKYSETNTINPDDYSISFNNIASRDKSTFDSFKLQASDLTFVTTPGDVGSYEVKLSDSGIARLKALDPGFATNYDWSENVTNARAAFEVVQMPVTVTVSDASTTGHQAITYGQTPTINDSDYTITVKTADGQTLDYTLVAGDLEFKNGTPTAVGTYEVVLSAQGLQNIENKFGTKNYSYSSKGNGTFEITAAKGTITLANNGTPGKVFDNGAASLNSGDYTLTIQTDNGPLTYNLQASDLRFVDENGNTITAPTNAGTYHVALTADAIAAIEALGGNNSKNYTWTIDQNATYTISPATANASLTGKDSKVYDGTAVTTAQVNANGGITVNVAYDTTPASAFPFETLAYVGGDNLLNYTLQDGDYTWCDSTGAALSEAPTNVGTYYIKLTTAGMQHIQAAIDQLVGKGNVALTDQSAGTAEFDITPFKVNITVDGSTSVPAGTTTIPSDVYSLDYSSGETGKNLPAGLTLPTGKLSADQLEFVGTAPTKDSAGQTFTVGYKGGQTALQTLLGDNYQVTYTAPTGNYIVTKASSQIVEYVDGDGNVIKTLDPINGDKGSEVPFDNAANMPAHWTLADGQTAPTTITIDGGVTKIKIQHATDVNQQTKEVTRTIIVNLPDGTTRTIHQTVDFTRTVTTDEVTGQTTYGNWQVSHTDSAAGDAQWDAYTAPVIAGYTASQTAVAAAQVDPGTADETVTINYTANSRPQPDNPDQPTKPDSPVGPDHGQQAGEDQGGQSTNGRGGHGTGSQQIGNSTAAQQNPAENSQFKQLPQTGNQGDVTLLSLGLLSATLATALGLGKRRKKNEY